MQFMDIRKEGPIGVMVMNYEEENHFDRPFVTEIMKALDDIEADNEIKSLVVTSKSEKFFCTGLHLQYMAKLPFNELTDFIAFFNNMLGRWCAFPKPVVGAINGHAFAGGAIMAAHFDFRYMRKDRGWVCVPEVDINIPFLPGMIAIFREILAPAAFREMALTGKRYTGPEAKALGFIDEVYEKEELLPKSIEMAKFLTTKNLSAYAEIKRRIRAETIRIIKEEDPKYITGGATNK